MRPYLCVALALVGACASYQRPDESLASSIAAARGAEEAGAPDVPEAKLYLTLAREEIAEAEKLMEEEEYERAELVTLRARADAELAVALARAEASRQEAERVRELAQKREKDLASQLGENQ